MATKTDDDVSQKDYPWAFWKKSRVWRDKLERQASHKALDIPDDDMGVRNKKKIDKSRHGLGSLGAIGVALAAGLPASLLALFLLLKSGEKPEKPTIPYKPPVVTPTNPPPTNGNGDTDVDVNARMEYQPPAE